MKKWEYFTIKLEATGWLGGGNVNVKKLDEYMNDLGYDGWELVSAFDTNCGHGETKEVLAIFKREIMC